MARHSAIEVATGAAVLVVAGAFLVFAIANTGQRFGGEAGYPLHASFDHVDGLLIGADVRIAGVKIGSIQTISLNPKTYLADVTFTVARNVSLSDDASATVSTDGLLGGKYLALADGGSDKTLKPGGAITITQGTVNIEALIGKYIFGGTGGGQKSGSGAAQKPPANGAAQPPQSGGLAPLK